MGNTHSSQPSGHMAYPTISPCPMVAMVNLANKSRFDLNDSTLTSRHYRNSFHNASYQEMNTIPGGEPTGRRVEEEQHSEQEWYMQHTQSDVTATNVKSLTDILLNESDHSCTTSQNYQYSVQSRSTKYNFDIDTNCNVDTKKDSGEISQKYIADNIERMKLQNSGSYTNIKNQKEKLHSSNQSHYCANVENIGLEQNACDESSLTQLSMTQLSLNESCFEEMTEADQDSSGWLQNQESNNDLVERGCSFRNNLYKLELNQPTTMENLTRSDINCEYERTLNKTSGMKTDENNRGMFVPSTSKENHTDMQHDVCFQQQRGESDGLIEVGRHSVFRDAKTGKCYSVMLGSFNGDSPPIYNDTKKPHFQRCKSSASDGYAETSASCHFSKLSPREDLSTCGGIYFRRDSELDSGGDGYQPYSYEEFEESICSNDSTEVKSFHDEVLGHGHQSPHDTFLETYPGASVIHHQRKVSPDRNFSCCDSSPLTLFQNKYGTERQVCSVRSRSNEKNASLPIRLDSSHRNHPTERFSGTGNRNALFTDCTAACSGCSWDMESSNEYPNKFSLSGNMVDNTHNKEQDNLEKEEYRQKDEEDQRGAQSDHKRNRETKIALSDFYSRFERNYVACLCCAEDVWDTFGLSFHHLLESWGLPIFCELRDLDLTGPYYENLTKCLEERCNGKIIVVLSHSYANSEECLFLTYFAKTLDPDSRRTNIIPVMIDKNVEIPNVLRGLAIINYNYLVKWGWLKQKMVTAIAA